MAYKVAVTQIRGDGFRPWQSRLGATRGLRGLGVYAPGEYVVPTTSDGVFQRMDYPFMDPSMSFKAGSQSVRNIQAIPVSPGSMPPNAVRPDAPVGVSGMGLDLSSLTSNPLLLWGGLAAAAWYFFFRHK